MTTKVSSFVPLCEQTAAHKLRLHKTQFFIPFIVPCIWIMGNEGRLL